MLGLIVKSDIFYYILLDTTHQRYCFICDLNIDPIVFKSYWEDLGCWVTFFNLGKKFLILSRFFFWANFKFWAKNKQLIISGQIYTIGIGFLSQCTWPQIPCTWCFEILQHSPRKKNLPNHQVPSLCSAQSLWVTDDGVYVVIQ